VMTTSNSISVKPRADLVLAFIGIRPFTPQKGGTRLNTSNLPLAPHQVERNLNEDGGKN